MILLIDNYDSFTYNLKQVIETLGHACTVARNDSISLSEVERLHPSQIVISPGPGNPDSAGITLDLIRHFTRPSNLNIPILGVCLGHQAIGQAFNAKIVRAPRPKHGKISKIFHQGRGLFKNAVSPFRATRYHSLMVERESLPSCLEISAESEDGVIMGLRHREFAVEGVQFHPESIATENGAQLLKNFFSFRGEK